ncbi:hypothetical protein ABID23_000570 [Bartonella silvatica]|uniref:Uncharacterized protein n=1 Tax=Bartonella silvatica TaxID=357760 RepID=A0ABV2HG36_9HYPH
MARNRSNMYWRAVSYYLSQSVSTISPSIEFMPIDSLQKINIRNTSKLKFYERFGLGVEPNLTMEESTKWLNALSGSEKSVA